MARIQREGEPVMIALAAHSRPAFRHDSDELVTAVAAQFASFALDCLETAVFVLDGDSRVHFTNAAARRLLDESRLQVRNGQLWSAIDCETTALRRLVNRCIEVPSVGPAQMTFQRLGDVENALCLAAIAAHRSGERQPGRP